MAPRREKSAALDAVGVIKFINLMKKYPIPSGRTSKVEVSETWKLLEREMEIPKTFLMTKWRNLAIAYRRELRMEMKVGSGFVSRWPYFKLMEFMRVETLCKMQTTLTRSSRGFAVNQHVMGQTKIIVPPLARVLLEKKEVKHEPVRALGHVEHCKTNIPITSVTINRGECTMSDPVYDFLMTRIHPYVVAMSTENRMKVLEQMQQLVFEVYQRRGNKVQESANMDRRCIESVFFGCMEINGHNDRL